MSSQLAMPNAISARGVRVEVVDGWGRRGEVNSRGVLTDFTPKGTIGHWTAGPEFNGNYEARPSLPICINGAAHGLDNALCNVYLDRAGVAVIVSANVAWHGGVGTFGGFGENRFWFGVECEASGLGDFTAEQLAAYPKLIAALNDLSGSDPARWAISHQEYAPKRKVDIGAYIGPIRNQAAAIWRGALPQGDEDMDAATYTAIVGRLDDIRTTLADQKPKVDQLQVAVCDPTSGTRALLLKASEALAKIAGKAGV